MKYLFVILLFSVNLSGALMAQNYLIKAYYNSDQLRKAWDNYKSDPTNENANIVNILLPDTGHVRKEDSDLALEEDIYMNLDILEGQVVKGNINSIKLAFRLFTISDGAFSESLDIIIGSIINPYPKLFLEELNNHIHLIDLRGLLCNYGPEYTDDFEMQKQETKKRIDSLYKVKNKELIKIRDLCIDELTDFLKYFE